MKKLIVFNLLTLDGFFEGPNREIDWHNVDEEFNEFAIQQLQTADAILFGRVTYQMMASFWPTSEARRDDPVVAGLMNNIPKYVFSNTLNSVDWQNTTLINGEARRSDRQIEAAARQKHIHFWQRQISVLPGSIQSHR